MDPSMAVFLTALAGVLSVLCLWRSHAANRRYRLVDALPTSRTQGVFIGLVELKGTAEGAPFTSFLTGLPCLVYSWSISEEWRRMVTETYRDQDGKMRTRQRMESGWTTLADGGESRPFYLQDDCGAVLVHPAGAEVRPFRLLSEQVDPSHPLYYGKGPPGSIPSSTGVRLFVEDGIPLHSRIFVVGQARERQDMVAAEVAAAQDVPLYLVTTEEETQVLNRFGRSRDGLGVLGMLLAAACGYGTGVLAGLPPEWTAAAGAGVFLVFWGLTWVWMLFNSLIDVRNRVRQGWSLIEVQLKRRHDLIPPLVAAVDGLRLHEKEVQEAVAELRAQARATPPGQPGADYHGTARRLTVLAEAYPVLNTSEAFLRLQQALTETEQRIALARDYFNGITTAYNTRLEVFPDSLIGRMFGFARQPLLMAEDFERAAVSLAIPVPAAAEEAGKLEPASAFPSSPAQNPPMPVSGAAPDSSGLERPEA